MLSLRRHEASVADYPICPEAVVRLSVVGGDVMAASLKKQPRQQRQTRCSFWAIAAARARDVAALEDAGRA